MALAVANLGAWVAALRMTGAYPMLIGSAALAYGLGLRHAFDADHIAAIDNVTRKLVADGARPAGVGLFFSLGHSSVVVGASVGIALAANRFKAELGHMAQIVGPFGEAFSSAFLFCVAGLNILVFAGVWRAVRRQGLEHHGPPSPGEPSRGVKGPFSWGLQRAIGRISRSWMMYPLGLVFALGFDTATEVGLLGLAAAQAAKGLPLWSILVFPALFAAGMALADTLEALFMLSAYRWTGNRPRTRLYYNLAATAASIVAGVTIGLGQLIGLAPQALSAWPALGHGVNLLARRSEWIGLSLVLLFAILWGGWALADRRRTLAFPPV